MYPNPSNDVLTIDYSDFSSGAFEVRLYDQKGRMVFEGEFDNQKASINTGQFVSGFYRVELRTVDTALEIN